MADRSSLEEGVQPTSETQSLLHHQTGSWKRGWKPHFVKIAIVITLVVFVIIAIITNTFKSKGDSPFFYYN